MFILLLRRLSPRGRAIFGVVLMAAGLALAGVSAAVSAGLLIHGIALIVIGAVLCTSAIVSAKRARLADQPTAGTGLTGAGRAHGR
jgi:drug/metabolite transporter (DMT)-like permease